eukprot:CAMPEP_0177768912 /NCGR_PEP_ID=MMETSP0491_2-20121128/9999_1 /TAXON_ID=63592 /ORGANISM="Tetraselmis chuii, Strain PLY429" /LENGTH=322 /DNA_ID=CAMNT_0019285801 /DNA_START=188 /DNA_END=1156 /DNA_ORIENTATION=+
MAETATTLIKAKTRKGKRILEARAPKLVEDPKRLLVAHGTKLGPLLKDVLTDLHRMKKYGNQGVKLSRKHENIRPFEVGGETSLEFFCQKSDAGAFAFGSHSKKRPDNLIMGRIFDGHLYDMVEFCVEAYKGITAFGNANAKIQLGNKPMFVFAGDKFENDSQHKMVKSVLLDVFRGIEVNNINLKGLDSVIFVAAASGRILFRVYAVGLKKSGTRVPKVELTQAGPSLDLSIRRTRAPPPDVEREAMKSKPKAVKKKVKNTAFDNIDGRVGRIYMPKQDVDTVALSKMKGVKRERREQAEEAKVTKQVRKDAPAEDSGGSD